MGAGKGEIRRMKSEQRRSLNAADKSPVEQWIANGCVSIYSQLSSEYQAAIKQHEGIGEKRLWAPDKLYGITEIPMSELCDAMIQSEFGKEFFDWDDLCDWFLDINRSGKAGGIPDYGDSIWPVILDRDYNEILQDGWHRLLSYHSKGLESVPAVFYPERERPWPRRKWSYWVGPKQTQKRKT